MYIIYAMYEYMYVDMWSIVILRKFLQICNAMICICSFIKEHFCILIYLFTYVFICISMYLFNYGNIICVIKFNLNIFDVH